MATGVRRWTDKFKWVAKGYQGLLEGGTSEMRIHITDASKYLVQFFSTTSLIAGSIKTMVIDQVYTGTTAMPTHNIEVFKVQLTSAGNTGPWVNAIFGRVNYSSTGHAWGSASAICGEMSWPTSGAGSGTFSVFQAEIDIPTATGERVGSEGSILRASLWGTGKGKFDDYGYLFSLQGFTAEDGHLIDASSTNIDFIADVLIKIKIGATDYWLGACDNKNGTS